MVFEEKTVSGRWPQIEALCHWGILGLVILCVIVNGLTGWGGAVFESLRENDKLGHAFFLGCLSFLIHRALMLQATCATGLVIVAALSVTFLLGIIDEYSQLWMIGRSFDYSDLQANFVGAALLGPMGCLVGDRAGGERSGVDEPLDSRLSSSKKQISKRHWSGVTSTQSVFLRPSIDRGNRGYRRHLKHRPH